MRQARRADAVVLAGSAIDIADAPPFWPVLSALRHRGAVAARRRDRRIAVAVAGTAAVTRGDGPAGAAARPPAPDDHGAGRAAAGAAGDRGPAAGPTGPPATWSPTSWRSSPTSRCWWWPPTAATAPAAPPTWRWRSPSCAATRRCAAMELAPLPREVVAELVAEWAPGRPELEELVWQRSAGNAFIAEETVRAVLGGDAQRPADHPARGRAEPHRGALARRAAGGAGDRRARRPAAPPAAGRRRRAAPGRAAGRDAGRGRAGRGRRGRERRAATGCGTA